MLEQKKISYLHYKHHIYMTHKSEETHLEHKHHR